MLRIVVGFEKRADDRNLRPMRALKGFVRQAWMIWGMDQAGLVEALQTECPSRCPSIWGAVYAHRSACLSAVRDRLDGLLADPTITRRALRGRLAGIVRTRLQQQY